MAIEEIRNERLNKLSLLKKEGIDPYPSKTNRSHLIKDILENFPTFDRGKESLTIAGRIIAKRDHGGSTFIDIMDESGKIQVYFREDILGKQYKIFLDTGDIGDIIEVSGEAFQTKKAEKSLEVKKWVMLAKSLRPLPEKWHGLQDVEERFRKRYLDILMNEEVKNRFVLRSNITRIIRDFFDKHEFLEVETPMLHHIPGGALAKPFITRHNALNIDLYLRIAPELYLKRLLVGGLERVYELGKSFRNEGIDAEHNPEFTSIEWYAAYWDEENMMEFVESCIAYILKCLKIKKHIKFKDRDITFDKKFARFTFKDVLKRYALITDYDSETRDTLATRARQFGIDTGKHESKGKIADQIYKKICRPYLIHPAFVINHPLDISPLAKKGSSPNEVRRFQLVVGGLEIVNAFSELNDPIDQRERFMDQEKLRKDGEDESHPLDEEYIEALEYGMPPAAGAAIGIDRLMMLLGDAENIREVVLFPTMRPR